MQSTPPNVQPTQGYTPVQLQPPVKRYTDGYRAAKFIGYAGELIKIAGILIGIIIGVAVAGLAEQLRILPSPFTAIAGFVIGGAILGIILILGIIVSALSQLLKSFLDTAVHTSPFLTNEHRARIMSL